MLLKRSSKHEASRGVETVVHDDATGLDIANGAYLASIRDRRITPMYELYSVAMGRPTPPSSERFMNDLSSCTAILYPSDGRLAGWCLWHVACKNVGEIVALSVREENRRSGVGSALMQAALRGMEDSRLDEAIVSSLVTTDAMGFYRQHGFDLVRHEAPGLKHAIEMHRPVQD